MRAVSSALDDVSRPYPQITQIDAWNLWINPIRMSSKSHFFEKSLLLLIVLAFANDTSAHEGPPFPLFVDQKVDRYVVSVWTDPDVGTALFFVIVNDQDLPPELHVRIGVQAVIGRLAEVFYLAGREKIQG